eukprot:338649_1
MSLQVPNNGIEPPNKRFKSSTVKSNTILMEKPVAIVLDIEGTVISKYFYDNILLPYTREHFRDFLREKSDIEYVSKRIELIKDQYFCEYPDKEQMFNDYFTEAAYNKYIQDIKQRQTKLNHINMQNKNNNNNNNNMNHINRSKPIELTESNPETIVIPNDIPIQRIDSTSPSVIILNDKQENKSNDNDIVELIDIDQNNNKENKIVELIDFEEDNNDNKNDKLMDKVYENED